MKILNYYNFQIVINFLLPVVPSKKGTSDEVAEGFGGVCGGVRGGVRG
jgi:hypothetical protein